MKRVVGSGGKGGGSAHIPYEYGDTLASRAYARVLDLLCEGPIDGFADQNGRKLVDAVLAEQPTITNGALGWDTDRYPLDLDGYHTGLVTPDDNVGYVIQSVDGLSAAGEVSCMIEGDGSNADIRAIVRPLSTHPQGVIYAIKVVNAGSGYTWCRVVIPSAIGTAILLDDIPIIDPSSFRANYPSIDVEFRLGTSDQSPLRNFAGAEEVKEVSKFPLTEQETRLGPYSVEIVGNYDSIIINISLANGLYLINRANGDVSGVDIPIEFRITQQYAENDGIYGEELPLGTLEDSDQQYFQITGKTRAAYIYSVSARLAKNPDAWAHKWKINFYRITGDDSEANSPWAGQSISSQTEIGVDSITLITEQPFRYPYSALVGLHADAEVFPTIPRRTYRVRMLQVQVPTNYFPKGTLRPDGTYRDYAEYNRLPNGTAAVTGGGDPIPQEWDGTFYNAWTDNPAWLFYNMCVNNRYGLGDFLPGTDKWTIYSLGQHCDELVPTGYGLGGFTTYEPRFSCNFYMQARQEAWQFLTDLASVFRGMIYWSGGLVQLSQDKEKDPVALFTSGANVTEEGFSYSGVSRLARRTVFIVKWNDPDAYYKLVPLVVEDEEAIRRLGYREKEITAFGCCTKGQARRAGLYALYNEKTNAQIVTWFTGLEAATLRPGDIVDTVDRDRTQVEYGGRVESTRLQSGSSNGIIVLDRLIDSADLAEDPSEYFITFAKPGGIPDPDSITNTTELNELIAKQVTTPAEGAIASFVQTAERTEIWLMGPIPDTVGPNTVYAIQHIDLVPQPVRVLTVSEEEKGLKYKIEALQYTPSLYDAADENQPIETLPTVGSLETWRVPQAPRNLTIYTVLLKEDGTNFWRQTVSWEPPAFGFAKEYIVEQRRGLGNFEILTTTRTTSIDTEVRAADSYTYRVRAVGLSGRRGPYVEKVVVIRDPVITNSELISGLEVNGQGNDWTIYTGDMELDWRVNWSEADSTFHTGEAPIRPPNVAHYKVEIFDPSYNLLATRLVTETNYTLTLAENLLLEGGPYRDLIFVIRAVTYDTQESLPTTIRVLNSLPAAPAAITANQNTTGQILVSIDDAPEADHVGYYAWMDTVSVFDWDDAHRVYRGQSSTFVIPVSSAGTKYLRIGKADIMSNEDSAKMWVSDEISIVIL